MMSIAGLADDSCGYRDTATTTVLLSRLVISAVSFDSGINAEKDGGRGGRRYTVIVKKANWK
jgi:hypothetical protein